MSSGLRIADAPPRERADTVGTVVKIEAYRARNTIETLEALLQGARQGRITGLAIAWKCRNGRHGGAMAGEYQHDQIAALGAVSKLWSQINNAVEESDDIL